MKGLGYIDDLNWVKDYQGLMRKYGIELEVCTHLDSLGNELKKYFKKVYVIGGETFYPDLIHKFLKDVTSEYDLILTPSTSKGRIFAGYAASILNKPVFTDVISIDFDSNVLERLVYGGIAKADIKFSMPSIISFVKGVFSSEISEYEGVVEKKEVGESKIKVEYKPRSIEGMDPTKAPIVVGAGRGFKDKKDLEMVDELAKLLGGAWSVTRPLAADYGWCDHWIGISGLVINPKVYILVGSSGQPHHMLGARGSKVIIAINKDRDAPVFEEADYGIVGDLYVILPRLVEKVKELKGV